MALKYFAELLHRGVTGNFFWWGKVIFPDFFPDVKCFFPVGNFHFGRPKTNCGHFVKWKAKKKKKSSPHFETFPSFHFQFSIFLLFSSNFPPFSFFPCLFFPGGWQEISPSEVFGGHSAPTCYATASTCVNIIVVFTQIQLLHTGSPSTGPGESHLPADLFLVMN